MFNKILTIAFGLAVIATVFTYANMAKAKVVTDGLVSYWPLDEIKGDIVKDVVGDNDGTVEGNPKIVEGKCDKALKFDGVSDYVSISTNNFPTGKSAMTWSAWFYRDKSTEGTVQYIAVFGDGGSAGGSFGVGVREGDRVFMSQWGGGAFDTFGPAVSLKQWHHVAAIRDDSSKTNILYLDGEEVTTQDCPDPNVVHPSGAIGGHPTRMVSLWNGTINEVGIYNRALSEEEVKQNFKPAAVESTQKLAITWGDIKISR